jgi:hypothetical protein
MIRILGPLALASVVYLSALFAEDKPKDVDDPVAAELAKAKQNYQAALKAASEKMGNAFAEQKKKLEDNKKLKVADQIKLLEQLQEEQKAFELDPEKLPKSTRMKFAVMDYQTQVSAARKRCETAFDKAAESYRANKDLTAAKEILAQKGRFLADPTLPSGDRFRYLDHKHSGKHLCAGNTENGSIVHLWAPIPEGHENRYMFKLVPSGETDYYYLLHAHSEKYVASKEKSNGARLMLWGPIATAEEDAYKFKLVKMGDGYYYLLHKLSKKYVATGDTENGKPIHLWGPIPSGQEDRYKFSFKDPR